MSYPLCEPPAGIACQHTATRYDGPTGDIPRCDEHTAHGTVGHVGWAAHCEVCGGLGRTEDCRRDHNRLLSGLRKLDGFTTGELYSLREAGVVDAVLLAELNARRLLRAVERVGR